MHKHVLLGGRWLDLEGLSDQDPYFLGLHDGYESDFANLCQNILRSTDVIMDIGANIGITTAVMSNLVPDGVIHAFEPSPAVFAVLQRNVARNSLTKVRCYETAISDRSGRVGYQELSAWGHITEGDSPALDVRTVTLDEWAANQDLTALDFVKMDIEGFEWAALRGGMGMIKRFRPVIYMEFNAFCQVTWSQTNPFQFATYLFENFPAIYFPQPDGRLHRFRLDAYNFTHEVMVHRHSNTNIVIAMDESRTASISVPS